MKTITVVAAIIKNDNKILCTQRPENKFDYISKKYEFPGGKVEAGETEKQALAREIQEELGMSIKIESKYMTVDHTYPDFRLIMHSFICSTESVEVHLHEHIAYKWLEAKDFNQLDWAAADVPIVEKLLTEV